jgi:hypothetical protein
MTTLDPEEVEFAANSGSTEEKPQLTPLPQKQMKGAKGRTFNVGDHIPGHGKIKSFYKDASGKVHADF